MSLFTGYNNKTVNINFEDKLSKKGDKMMGPIDMSFWGIKNIPAPVDDFDPVSKKVIEEIYFRNYQSIVYKYPGLSKSDIRPEYEHNFRGNDILHSEKCNSETKIRVKEIILDDDSTNYKLLVRFSLELVYKDNTKSTYVIADVDLSKKPNYDIVMSGNTHPRFIFLDLEVKLGDATNKPNDVRFILLLVRQMTGATAGNEYMIHIETSNF